MLRCANTPGLAQSHGRARHPLEPGQRDHPRGSLNEHAGDRLEAAYVLARKSLRPPLSLIATGGGRRPEQ
ncbi:hypothetical protein J7E88_28245 [Streptomyces sp. ISL-10]|uniref:hypothetical protein n=1 Tax=Streptomyces sp. ISL-10 TaxID=2819172 RepID=UPI001BE71176|nr:hypothetical protein [Streptomyces sp. ISL-10]MBT2369102.1 hypothetical protein [Streptomyces sp. ISL-10]